MTKQRRKPRSPSKARSSSDGQETQPRGNPLRIRKFKVFILAFSLLLFVGLDLICGTFLVSDQQQSFRRPHPYYHHALRANQNRTTHWGGRRYRMITNSLAMRDRQTRDVPLHSDAKRVVLIGDSMIEGIGVPYEETVAGLLEQRWAPKGVEVLNAGVVSYSPHLYHLKVRYLLEEVGLQFNQLIVFIDISDIQDETFYERFQPAASNSQLGEWWRRHSLAFRVADQFSAKRPSNQFRTDAEVNVWMEATEAYHTQTDPEVGRWQWTVNDAVYEQWGKKGLDLARQHMAALNDLCREHRIELSVVVYPSPVQIFANDVDSRQVRFWREFCQEFDRTLIDLFPTLIDHSYSGPTEIYQRFYLESDTHWNPTGHRLVADKIDEVIGPTLGAGP